MSRHMESHVEWLRRTEEQAARREAAPNFVYRVFDDYGHLLYVGCSLDVDKRMKVHRREAPWFKYATTIASFGPWPRSEAMRREREAIETESPYFNSSMANHRLVQLRDPRATNAIDRLASYRAARARSQQQRQQERAA